MEDHSPKKSPLSNNKSLVYLAIVGVVVHVTVELFWSVVTVPVPLPTPVIYTSDGPVQGNIEYSRSGQEYWQFLGIPYAMPPVGALKFQPPVPVKPWKNVKQVTSYPPDCLQFDYLIVSRVVGEMDCLFLNVFVNAAHGNVTKKPVLAYLYGGAFIIGGSRVYHPDYFMDRDVILVVMNYRLGPYGFLNLQGEEDEDVPQGNMGLKDQNLALQWIQKNIDQFGGDPDKVTLFGESAGAASTHFHMLSSESRGLFQRAIVQSASALSPCAFSISPRDLAMHHAEKFGCPENDKNTLWDCYKRVINERDVVRHQNIIYEPVTKKDVFEPTVDGTFLKTPPQDRFKEGESLLPTIPIMFGVNSGEGILRTARFDAMPELIPKLDEEWTDLVANLLVLDTPISTEVALEIREKYFNGNVKFVDDVEGFKRNLTLLVSDSNFYYPEHKAAVFHAKLGSPTYMYYFNYTSKVFPGFYSVFRASRLDDWIPAFMKLFWATTSDWVEEYVLGGGGARKYGVSHAEGILQLFNVLGVTKWMSYMDLEFSQGYIDAIVDFANDTQRLTFRGTPWPSINDHLNYGKDEYTIPYMLMDGKKKPTVISEPFGSRMKFWANLRGWEY